VSAIFVSLSLFYYGIRDRPSDSHKPLEVAAGAFSIMNHATVRVSVLLLDVIVKLAPAEIADIESSPAVPEIFCPVRKTIELVSTAVVETVTVPPTKTAVPFG